MNAQGPTSNAGRSVCLCAAAAAMVICALTACSDPDRENVKKTTIPTYDKKTGKLTELTYDRNHNGVIDTWTEMDGKRPVMSRIDLNEDGKIDRWEYYDANGQVARVGFSRIDDGKPDAWAFPGPDGTIVRVEMSSSGDEKKIDRREFYERGVMVRVEEDTKGRGRPDKWETYENGALATVAFDETGDGKPDRRLTYRGGALVRIESGLDPTGRYTRVVDLR